MKLNKQYLLVFVVACFLLKMQITAHALNIVEKHKPAGRIVVDENDSSVAKFAAEELQRYVRKVSGAELPIVSQSDGGQIEIVVGPKAAKKLGVDLKRVARDAYRIKRIGKKLIIAGQDDAKIDVKKWLNLSSFNGVFFEAGTLFGVYEYLERFLGIRWYLPGELGEVVPKNKSIGLPKVDLIDSPNKNTRYIHPPHGADDRDDPYPKPLQSGEFRGGWVSGFEGRKRTEFNCKRKLFFLKLRHQTMPKPYSHTMWKLVAPKFFLKTHPEYFATYANGRSGGAVADHRVCQYCYSCPGLINKLIIQAKAALAGKAARSVGVRDWRGLLYDFRGNKAFHIIPNDGYKKCQCKMCNEFRRNHNGKTEQIEADLVWGALIKVANAINKEFPKAVISTALYGPLKNLPTMKLPNNIIVARIAQKGPYDVFIPGLKASEEKRLQKAVKEFGNDRIGGFWNYPMLGAWENGIYKGRRAVCTSVPRAYADYYARFKDIGDGSDAYVLSHNFAYDHLNIYVFYKYHWNADVDVDELLGEYYRLFYGPAELPMRNFWEEVEKACRLIPTRVIETPLGPKSVWQDEETLWRDIYSPVIMKRWKQYFNEAAMLAAKSSDPVYGKRVAYMKRNVLGLILEGASAYREMRRFCKQLRIEAKYTSELPVIDGILNDSCWKNAVPVSLGLMDSQTVPADKTFVKAAWDERNLYLAVMCEEPKLVSRREVAVLIDKASVWRDNGLELFIDPDNIGQKCFQFLFNSKGVWADCVCRGRKSIDFSWNSNFKHAVRRTKNTYTLEVAIPLKNISKELPDNGTLWSFNIIRKQVGAKGVAHGVYHSWSPYIHKNQGFIRPAALGRIEFVNE